MNEKGGHHHDEVDLRGRKLIVTIILNLLITVGQVIGAVFSNSLSLH
jgi:cobalt-zinc-cadmium efflux system protein